MEETISPFASMSTSKRLRRCSGGRAALRVRLRQATSTNTMALSTTSPTATARPPRVMMLTASPKVGNKAMPRMTERGMVMSVMIAVRRFSSVSTITSITTIPAMMSVSLPFSRERLMKSAWR